MSACESNLAMISRWFYALLLILAIWKSPFNSSIGSADRTMDQEFLDAHSVGTWVRLKFMENIIQQWELINILGGCHSAFHMKSRGARVKMMSRLEYFWATHNLGCFSLFELECIRLNKYIWAQTTKFELNQSSTIVKVSQITRFSPFPLGWHFTSVRPDEFPFNQDSFTPNKHLLCNTSSMLIHNMISSPILIEIFRNREI